MSSNHQRLVQASVLFAALAFLLPAALYGQRTAPVPLGQPDAGLHESSSRFSIHTTDLREAQAKLRSFLSETGARILSENQSTEFSEYEFLLSERDLRRLDTLLPSLGYTRNRSSSNSSNTAKTAAIRTELNYMQEKIRSYTAELSKLDSASAMRALYWQELRNFEERELQLRLQLSAAETGSNLHHVSLNLSDAGVTPGAESAFFINMPGVEFGLLSIENPTPDISAALYRGASLKYLFTRGKSYITVGAYRAASTDGAGAPFTELFLASFAQDFYSRYLGRGENMFLNLYSGYSIGGVFASGEQKSESMFSGGVHLGLELYKSSYVLVDNKVTYFIPFKFNRSLRGLLYNISVNFVF